MSSHLLSTSSPLGPLSGDPLAGHEFPKKRHYQPNLVRLDGMVNTVSQWVYSQASRQSRGSFDAAERLIAEENPSIDGILEWKRIVTVRNEVAALCGVCDRGYNCEAEGYTVNGNNPTSSLPQLTLTDVRVGGRPMTNIISAVPQQDLEQVFLPLLYSLEATISNMERLLYEEEYFRNGGSEKKADSTIKNPAHSTTTALRRDTLLEIRNALAARIGLPIRAKHDYDSRGTSSWLITIENIPVPNFLRDEQDFAGFQPAP